MNVSMRWLLLAVGSASALEPACGTSEEAGPAGETPGGSENGRADAMGRGDGGANGGGSSVTPASDEPPARDAGDDVPICLEFATPELSGSVDIPELDQLSGLVASRSQPGVLFAHEDSTGAPIIYALDLEGHGLAALTLDGAPNTDWEDIAVGVDARGESLLYIGDIGDNAVRTGGAARSELRIIRLAEPTIALGAAFTEQTLSSFDVLRLRYPSGVHESETLMVDPSSGDLVIVTRSVTGDSRVFRTPAGIEPDTPTTLEEIASIAFDPDGQGALATAGDISPSGDRVLVRTYTNVYAWPRAPGVNLARVFESAPVIMPWAIEPQGEAITFTADGHAWLSSGEQITAIYRAAETCP